QRQLWRLPRRLGYAPGHRRYDQGPCAAAAGLCHGVERRPRAEERESVRGS
ncbi:unnamed protein product, partial [Polarella glacialis]